ncbi:MAG TPA: hypothetical protein DEA05_08510 [Rhodobacteraceae bacterium]|nr:hypothetical protein [Paracoccaceae bacterium]
MAGGEMDRERAERILREYDGAFREFQRSMGHTQAEIEAARAVQGKARAEAAEKRRVMQLQAAASRRQIERLQRHRNIRGELDPAQYLQDLVSNTRGAGGSTLAGKYEAVRRSFRRDMTDAVRTFRANLVGQRRKPEMLRKVVREVFGEDTGDAAARAIAQSWAGVAEKARLRFNAAGGHIGKRSDWGLPQAHDSAKVRRATYREWRDFIMPRLDLEAMGRDFNNGLAFTNETLEVLMKDAFEAIRTDGYSRRSPAARYGSAMYNRRADHRFFKFKSADDWMDYSERFGSGQDAFRVMMGHLDNMAMDIAMMEELGPNPFHTFRYLSDAAQQLASRSAEPNALDRARRKSKVADDMMDLFTGRSNMPQSARVARGAAALRNYLTSAHLGSAIISSVTDFNTQRIAAGFVGMSRLGFMRQLVRLATSPAMRAQANEAGLIFENAVDIGNATARYELEELHVESAARLADFTIRASGLGWLTEVQRQSFGLEFMSQAAKWRAGSWADLPGRTQRMFKSYGIGENDWPVIRRARIHETENGLRILRAQEIEEAGDAGLADRYMEAVTSLTEFAVPSSNIFGRATILGRTQPGSISGEILRFGLQFKSFPVTMLVTQFGRIMAEAYQGRPGSALSYAAGLLIGNTILGALAIQMKETAKGRDPRDMTSAEFWVAAIAQGGGAGIFGDFFFSDVNRFGGGMAETLAGPGVGFLDDMLRFTVGNARELALGEDTRAGRELVGLLRNYTPGGSLWYLRLAYEREVLDQLQQVIDPDAARSFRRRVQNAREYDTQFFAPPGSSVIQGRGSLRAPDIANAFGG